MRINAAMNVRRFLLFLAVNAAAMTAFGSEMRAVLLVTGCWTLGFLIKWWEVSMELKGPLSSRPP